MKKKVMISSFFSANTIKPLIIRFSITELFLVVEKNLSKIKTYDTEKKIDALNKIKEEFKGIININILEVESLYRLYEISKSVVNKIDSLEGSEIYLNISEGRKPLSFGMYFAGNLRKNKIKGIYYLKKEDNELLKMPFPNFNINKFQKQILKFIEKKEKNFKEIRDKFEKKEGGRDKNKKTKSVVYKSINDLENNGYIKIEERNISITDLGRILLL